MSSTESSLRVLDSFEKDVRTEAFERLLTQANTADTELPAPGRDFNLHCHSFFSFNGYGYSPLGLAWRGRVQGLCAMALVDFDVLDGVDEFLAACRTLGLRAGAGLETRVFVPEFGEDEINSPGEPGVAYHIGIGFVSSEVADPQLLRHLKTLAQNRTRTIVERVNTLLHEIALDYEQDVLTLTPMGNSTERHVCAAYDGKGRDCFPDGDSLAAYWSGKLGMDQAEAARLLKEPPVFQGAIRARTMKSGGVGYIPARGEDFPRLEKVNAFILENGAIPTFAFLDGTSSGEQRMDELLDIMIRSGVAAVNIIPDRNWNIANPETRALKVQKLGEFIRQAQARDLPIFVGTEMNAHGQRFVDDFAACEMEPHFEAFREGMHILHAHTVLQSIAGMGYVSRWAKDTFSTAGEKNLFYRSFGERMSPGQEVLLAGLTDSATPDQILKRLPNE